MPKNIYYTMSHYNIHPRNTRFHCKDCRHSTIYPISVRLYRCHIFDRDVLYDDDPCMFGEFDVQGIVNIGCLEINKD